MAGADLKKTHHTMRGRGEPTRCQGFLLNFGKNKIHSKKCNTQENKQPGSLHELTSHKLVILITMGKQLRESSGLIPLRSAPRLCPRMHLSAWGIPLQLHWVGAGRGGVVRERS